MSEGYNSFYGGRRGASFVIVEKYKSVEEMIEAFKGGGNYTTVGYDEYVLILKIKIMLTMEKFIVEVMIIKMN